ncbi:MAG: sensor histidine kinase [Tepidiformaceae bacterium]
MVAASVLTLLMAGWLMDAPRGDLAVLGTSLLGTGLAGVAVAVAAQRWSGGLALSAQLALFATLGCTLLVANIGVAAALMFLSTHDLKLLFILSSYAMLATVGPAFLMSRGISQRIAAVQAGAERIAAGELGTRVQLRGGDEVAHLGEAFNQMANALERANRERAELEEARRDLFAAISHDLRTPLASMRAMVEAIADGVVTDEGTRGRYLQTMSAEIARLSLLIDDLFELTTIDSGELRLRLELLRIEDVVAEAVDAFRPQVERAGIRLAFEPAAQTPPVRADAQRMSRVLYNLLQNALRHTPGEGRIVLHTAATTGMVRVAISDSGEGISAVDAPHVFDRFYRGEKSRSREHGGSGLGLSIARGIVEAHGGRIWVESQSELGRGATVAFTLPCVN